MDAEVEELLAEIQAEESADIGGAEDLEETESGPEGEADDTNAGDEGGDEGELDEDDSFEEGAEDEGAESDEDEGPEGDLEDDVEDEESESESNELAEANARLEQLEHELRLMRQEKAQGQQQQPQAPQRPAINPALTEAVNIAFYGGDDAVEKLKAFSPEVRAEAIKGAREANRLAVLAVTDPEEHYHQTVGRFVNGHIRSYTDKFEEQRRASSADAAVAKHAAHLGTPGAKERVMAIMGKMPMGGTLEQRLDYAVRLDRAESGARGRARKSQGDKSRDRDVAAKSKAKRNRGGRGRRRSGGKPTVKDHGMDDVMADAAQLSKLSDAELDKLTS